VLRHSIEALVQGMIDGLHTMSPSREYLFECRRSLRRAAKSIFGVSALESRIDHDWEEPLRKRRASHTANTPQPREQGDGNAQQTRAATQQRANRRGARAKPITRTHTGEGTQEKN
jgi:hypothetical protein